MKKSIFLFFAAILCAIGVDARTIYLKPNSNWTSDNAWFMVYLCNGTETASWHKMTKVNNSLYKVEIADNKLTTAKNKNILFCRMNKDKTTGSWDNVWNKTNDLNVSDLANNNHYTIASGAWSNGSGNWSHYGLYLAGEMNGWSAVTNAFSDESKLTIHLDAKTYKFKVVNSGSWLGNNGTMDRGNCTGWTFKTEYGDAQITADVAGDYTFIWKDSKLSVVYPTYVTGNKELVGATKEWQENALLMNYENGVFSYTFENIPAGQECKLKVTIGNWSKAWGYKELSKYIEGVTYDGNDNNACFTLKNSGNVTVTFNGNQITDITTTGEFVSPIYTIVGAEPLMGYNFDVNQNQMTREEATKYTLERTVALPVGTYEYRVAQNYQYLWSVPANGNATLKIDKAGTGKVKFTLDPSKPEVTTELIDWVEGEVNHVVKLSGIGNEDILFSQSADNLSTSAEVTLDANKVYEFNVIVDGTYTYNQGNMWRGNCTGWTFQTAAEGNNAHIITDLAGTYTFTWTYGASKQLTVTYPDGTNVPAPIFLAGKMNGWDRLATRLIPSTDGTTASATIELERNVYNEFRMIIGTEDWTNKGTMDRDNCTGWTFDKVTEENKDDNAGIVPDATGEYIFTWSYAENKLSVTYPEETCTDCSSWYLCGSFNEWGLANEFTKADDKIVTTTVRLEAGEYEFKVQDMTDPRDGKWWGNKGKMQRNSDGLTTGWTFEQKSGDEYNCTIVADIAGDYTFTWNTDTKKLTVQYPTLTITLTTGNNDDVIAANIGNTVDVVIERSFTADDGYYTLCVPFNMDPSVIGKAYYLGDDIKKHVSGEGIDIELVEEKDMLLAGVPYLVLPEANMSELVVENVTIQSDPASGQNITDENVQIFFEGFYSASGQTNGTTQYYVGNNGYLYNKVVDIRGLCGLFTINDENGAPLNVRARVVTREDAATGLDNNQLPITNIQKAIENGQLIIIRDGVKYNVQGVRL